jgi:hypothetical protein
LGSGIGRTSVFGCEIAVSMPMESSNVGRTACFAGREGSALVVYVFVMTGTRMERGACAELCDERKGAATIEGAAGTARATRVTVGTFSGGNSSGVVERGRSKEIVFPPALRAAATGTT